ncbi:peroxisomal acyl-coenzyme A oxidase 3 isoform X2 [Culicoides brevitarsis]|uniref:peroxisomal acyl-coenzyme A oxidase 3 isoform X2 n=1 Tax=Culicoides brevitarsis TaxID=469753 RepID=UPI00307C6092
MQGEAIFENKDIFPDFPTTGPLAKYRSSATFDWKKLKLIIEDEEALLFRQRIFNFFRDHPYFVRKLEESLTMDQQRHLASKRMLVGFNEHFFGVDQFIQRPDLSYHFVSSLMAFCPSFAIKGNERLYQYVEANENMEIYGAFALTEISHGTNARGVRTTATYDVKSKGFIMNTPDFEAAKCWVGNLGKTCTHAIVYAQLYTPDGKNHGLNAFLVPIRDPKTLLCFPGVRAGDMGEKIGLNGVDNGFVMFDNYLISKDMLLSRTGDVTDDGKFVTPFKDKSKRLGASLGALSGGRVSICGIASTYCTKAITIAIRYSAARRQFGEDSEGNELPVLEYQSQQFRLLPHLASTFALNIFSHWLSVQHGDMFLRTTLGEKLPHVGMEIHALSSACKPFCTWAARDIIQECREACGGHGYLKISRLGDLRNDADANLTYEGENNVLGQQASNWLLNVEKRNAFGEESPLNSADFLQNYRAILQTKFPTNNFSEATSSKIILDSLNWLCAFTLNKTIEKSKKIQKKSSAFDLRNNIQVFHAKTLSICYAQRNVYRVFYDFVNKLPNSSEKEALHDLLVLFGANLMLQNASLFYQGAYFNRSEDIQIFENLITEQLLGKIKNNCIALTDSIAYPDHVINSCLGHSDGNVYKHLKAAFFDNPATFERPQWWETLVHKDKTILNAKL